MAHVFLSYSRKDTEFVETLERDLNARGIVTWRDSSNIPGGEDWYDSIVQGIDASYAFISIVTPNAGLSRWVRREALYADELGLTIIPVLPAPHRVPFYAINVQPIDCGEGSYEDGLAQIVGLLNGMDQSTPAARPVSGRSTAERAYLDFLLSEAKADLRDALYVNLLASPEKARKQVSALAFGLDDDSFGFERLGLAKVRGDNFDAEGETVPDARSAIREMQRALVLGDPGSGKTTTLLQLAVDTAREAQTNPKARLPVFVPLRQFNGETSFPDFVRANMHTLQDEYADVLARGQLLLLLDALNEMPRQAEDGRDLVAEVREYLADKQNWVVSCRVRDYQEDLSEIKDLGKIQIKPLDPPRIYEVIQRRFADDPDTGAALWRDMHGSDDLLKAWEFFASMGRQAAFWGREWPKDVKPEGEEYRWTSPGYNDWHTMQRDRRRMLRLCRNPYMTNMVCKLYARTRALPENRGALFAAFADELLRREEILCRQTGAAWIDAQHIRSGLAGIAFALGAETEMTRTAAENILRERVPDQDVGLLLRLASAASLIEAGDNVRFTHQLLQEYFAGEVLGIEMDSGRPASDFWQPGNWWEANGREETAIILAGVRGDPEAVARWIAPAQPELAYQVLTESGIELDLSDLNPTTRQALIDGANAKTGTPNPVGRAAAYRVLGHFHADNRPGVGITGGAHRAAPLPDIDWVEVPAGTFIMGSDKAHDEQADNDEMPQHEVTLDAFQISKFPLTNAQFAPFVSGDGYRNPDYWTEAGWQQKEREGWTQPHYWEDTPWNLPNHPVVGVSWYEAHAYCRWLSVKLGAEIRLPTEAEWEKAARGRDGRIYPYDDKFDPAKGNTGETGIGQTSAVGIFPDGASPYGVLDMSGNVWEWCLTKWRSNYTEHADDDPQTNALRVLRGGSWSYSHNHARGASRLINPVNRSLNFGFRLVRAPSL